MTLIVAILTVAMLPGLLLIARCFTARSDQFVHSALTIWMVLALASAAVWVFRTDGLVEAVATGFACMYGGLALFFLFAIQTDIENPNWE